MLKHVRMSFNENVACYFLRTSGWPFSLSVKSWFHVFGLLPSSQIYILLHLTKLCWIFFIADIYCCCAITSHYIYAHWQWNESNLCTHPVLKFRKNHTNFFFHVLFVGAEITAHLQVNVIWLTSGPWGEVFQQKTCCLDQQLKHKYLEKKKIRGIENAD